MRKGLSVCVFVLGLVMTCASAAVVTLGAVGMGGAKRRQRGFYRISRKNS